MKGEMTALQVYSGAVQGMQFWFQGVRSAPGVASF